MTGLSLFGAATGGGPQRLEIDPNRAMSESLSKAMGSIDPHCEAELERERRKLTASEIQLAPNECRRTPVCLPGAAGPTMMLVCAPAQTGADAAAPTRTEAAAPARSEWTWTTED